MMNYTKAEVVRHLRFWLKQAKATGVNVNAVDAKETEEGKEEIPPAPPIEEKGEGKEKAEAQYARAREVFSSRKEKVEAVAKYNTELQGDIDAEFFVDYYADKWPTNWKARFRNWLKIGIRRGRIQTTTPTQAEVPRTFTLADWSLCDERCAHFQEGKCRRGILTPPEKSANPFPPEECHKFKSAGTDPANRGARPHVSEEMTIKGDKIS